MMIHTAGYLSILKSYSSYTKVWDLEINGIECLWIELRIQNKQILYGTFYRPPNSSSLISSNFENSIVLAHDSNISDVIITVR